MTVGLVEREREGFDWVGARCVLTLLLGTQRERERERVHMAIYVA